MWDYIEDIVTVVLILVAILTFIFYHDIVARIWAFIALAWIIWYEIS